MGMSAETAVRDRTSRGKSSTAPKALRSETGRRSGTSSATTVASSTPLTPAKPTGSSTTPTVLAAPPMPRAAAGLSNHKQRRPCARSASQRRRRAGLPFNPSCAQVSTRGLVVCSGNAYERAL